MSTATNENARLAPGEFGNATHTPTERNAMSRRNVTASVVTTPAPTLIVRAIVTSPPEHVDRVIEVRFIDQPTTPPAPRRGPRGVDHARHLAAVRQANGSRVVLSRNGVVQRFPTVALAAKAVGVDRATAHRALRGGGVLYNGWSIAREAT